MKKNNKLCRDFQAWATGRTPATGSGDLLFQRIFPTLCPTNTQLPMTDSLLITTDRLVLRPIRREDAEAIFRYRKDPIVNKYQGWIPQTLDDVDDFIMQKASRTIDVPGTWFQLSILKKDTAELIGDIGIHFSPTASHEVEVGCTLHTDEQGKGFAVEALSETIQYLFSTLNKSRVTASIDPRNTKSVAMVHRIGFLKVGEHNERIFLNGEWVEDAIYELVKK
jgi:RimJ/RimL family protein N-acetyltransferase